MLTTLNKFYYRNFGRLTFNPFLTKPPPSTSSELASIVLSIQAWAKENGARYYSFLPYPHTEGIAEKQETFLHLQYSLSNLTQYFAS